MQDNTNTTEDVRDPAALAAELADEHVADIARFDRLDPARTDAAVGRELLAVWEALDAQSLLAPRALAILHPQIARAGALKGSSATLFVDGTLIDITTRAEAVAVERVALLFTRQNRLSEFGINELFGADGWERYMDGFAELAAITREPEMEPEGMTMTT